LLLSSASNGSWFLVILLLSSIKLTKTRTCQCGTHGVPHKEGRRSSLTRIPPMQSY
jgi:hypothetical protein